MKVSIYGVGNFGFALLRHLDSDAESKGLNLYAYDRDKKLCKSLRTSGKHIKHHLTMKVSGRVIVTEGAGGLIDACDVLILAVTSDAIREILPKIRPHINRKLIVLNTAKALDAKTGMRFSEVISQQLGIQKYPITTAMLAGGTIASDLLRGYPLGVSVGSENRSALENLKKLLEAKNLNVYTTDDLAGVEYAGAFKNVISILAGMMHGLGFSYGSETYIITRAAEEARNLALGLGARDETFSLESQCWGNDMVMSATGKTRNREFGTLLGKGYSAEKALAKMHRENKTVEGVNTLKVMKRVIGKNSDEFPFLYNLGDIVFGEKRREDARKVILDLVLGGG